jgi:polynucleotide 5'-hydroxyl-kinase GRC3/NOL9
MPNEIPDAWQAAARRIAALSPPRIVFVAGATDTGKTALCRYLQDRLARPAKRNGEGPGVGKPAEGKPGEGLPAAYLDCDPGQSVIGPPATVGLWTPAESGGGRTWLRFVGSTSSSGSLLQAAVGIRRLEDRALREGSHSLLVDSSGFVEGEVAREFQFRVIELLRPRAIVGFEGRSVRALLAAFRRSAEVIFLEVDRRVRTKSPEARRAYRRERFRSYFQEGRLQNISIRNLGLHGRVPPFRSAALWRDLLCAFCDPRGMVLALGIIRELDLDRGVIRCLAPSFVHGQAASIQFGSLRLDREGRELR